jgi:hypothetical protein
MRKQKEVQPEVTFEQAVELAAGVVAELRDMARQRYAELAHGNISLHGTGGTMDMPKDTVGAAHFHRLGVACDNFLNAVRGNY